MRVLIIGCGYVGLPVGAELVRRGHEVAGLRRTLINAEELTTRRIRPLAADITNCVGFPPVMIGSSTASRPAAAVRKAIAQLTWRERVTCWNGLRLRPR